MSEKLLSVRLTQPHLQFLMVTRVRPYLTKVDPSEWIAAYAIWLSPDRSGGPRSSYAARERLMSAFRGSALMLQ